LTERHNKTSNSSILFPKHIITLRAEEPQQFAKFGANMDSDGLDALYISSGWANDENGAVWFYNITKALFVPPPPPLQWQDRIQRIFSSPDADHYDVAGVFAHGRESKVQIGIVTSH
jgi:hypothetical protein